MLNDATIQSTLLKMLGFAFILLAIFIAIKGRRGSVADAGSGLLVAVIAIVVASLGGLMMTNFGPNAIAAIFKVN